MYLWATLKRGNAKGIVFGRTGKMERISEVRDTISKHISKDHQHQRYTTIHRPSTTSIHFLFCLLWLWGLRGVALGSGSIEVPPKHENTASWSWYFPIILYNSLLVIIVLAAVFSHTKPLYCMKGQSLFSYSPEDEDAPFWSINYIWICAYSLKNIFYYFGQELPRFQLTSTLCWKRDDDGPNG